MFFFLLWVVTALTALRYYRLSMTDDLTGLGNRRCLARRMKAYGRRAAVTVLYFDLDHLKQVNDQDGHDNGDALLRTMAAALTDVCIPGETAYRIGGDEFLLLSPAADPADLLNRWQTRGGGIAATAGVASGAGRELEALIRQAEQDMYGKRKQGKG